MSNARSTDRALRTQRIRVAGGFAPDTVRATAGRPLRLVFRREETARCSERVVFPALGRSAMLPVGSDVALDVVFSDAGTYPFTCQMGMLRGLVIVEDAP